MTRTTPDLKVVLLAGGLGTRLSEETVIRPKPMVEIGHKPILWHIMKYFESYGLRRFVVCLGYRGEMIKDFFAGYKLHRSDFTIQTSTGATSVSRAGSEDWEVTLVDTGLATSTGGRLRRVRSYIKDGTFIMTYGDGLSDVPLDRLIQSHRRNRKLATVTAVQPRGRFGVLDVDAHGLVRGFAEKPKGDGVWINGGFFVLEPDVLRLIEGDATAWEAEPLSRLVARRELAAFKHSGFWAAMDTMSDKRFLEAVWESGKAPWRRWSDQE